MNQSEEYGSESDLSDEDFCPENEAASELSEESSDDEIEEDDKKPADETKVTKKPRKSRKKKSTSKPTKQTEVQIKRSTRTAQAETNAADSKKPEKDELESDDEEKGRADALWADFLGDVQQTPTDFKKKETVSEKSSPTRKPQKTNITAPNNPVTVAETLSNGDSSNGKVTELEKDNDDGKPQKMTITEIMDFAGEEVKVQKVVSAESIKENKTGCSTSKPAIGVKRAAGPSGSGLGSILNHIGKKKKISVLEKTKLDWNSFKQDEGIEEELQTFNKGKDGYLERQDFLQRTDIRQFEIERNLRQSRRNH